MTLVRATHRSKLGVVLGVLFIITGAMKIIGVDMMATQFDAWDYSVGFRFVIGIVEVAAGLGLMFPISARWSALTLMAVMVGAVYTHVFRGEWLLAAAVPLFVFILLTVVAIRPYKRVDIHQRTSLHPRDGYDWTLDSTVGRESRA